MASTTDRSTSSSATDGSGSAPRVTVLTPIYNGDAYIEECVDSVLRQTYTNFEYIFVNNCSTDRTPEILARYAEMDSRIRIVNNTTFVGVIENHNNAFALVLPESKYTKIVSGDDWIYPECIERMVAVAERHPSVAIVGCYAISNVGALRQIDTPQGRERFSGQEIARLHLMGTHVLGPPTSLLYRSDVVRAKQPFFDGNLPSSDHHAIFRILQNHDYGFVPQILSFERWHESTVSSSLMSLNSFLVDRIDFLKEYGDAYLSPAERDRRMKKLFAGYYDFLADSAVHRAPKKFWDYHRERLAALGYPISKSRIAGLVGLKMLDWVGNPKRSVEKVLNRFK